MLQLADCLQVQNSHFDKLWTLPPLYKRKIEQMDENFNEISDTKKRLLIKRVQIMNTDEVCGDNSVFFSNNNILKIHGDGKLRKCMQLESEINIGYHEYEISCDRIHVDGHILFGIYLGTDAYGLILIKFDLKQKQRVVSLFHKRNNCNRGGIQSMALKGYLYFRDNAEYKWNGDELMEIKTTKLWSRNSKVVNGILFDGKLRKDSLHCYSSQLDKWMRINVKLPDQLVAAWDNYRYCSGKFRIRREYQEIEFTLSKDKRYVIFIGSEDIGICVLDLVQKQVFKSSIVADFGPLKRCFVVEEPDLNLEIICSGYVRQITECSSSQIGSDVNMDVMRLIEEYCGSSREYLHLVYMDMTKLKVVHSKIGLPLLTASLCLYEEALEKAKQNKKNERYSLRYCE
eukprot:57315_1